MSRRRGNPGDRHPGNGYTRLRNQSGAAAWRTRLCGLLAVVSAEASSPVHRSPPAPEGGCVTSECHGDLVRREHLHVPAAQRKCTACHSLRSAEAHTFDLRLPADRLCTQCHTLKRPDFLHAPVRDGNCTACHDPHGSEHRFMLRADPVEDLCRNCHDTQKSPSRAFIHAPVAAGTCVLCHEAHGSWQPHLLVESGRGLCTSCHASVERAFRGGSSLHEPAAEGRCTACHDPHAADHPMQLAADTPELCNSCHPEIQERIVNAATVHEVVRTDRSCANCHDPHAGAYDKLLASAPSDLCLTCHDRTIPMADGVALQDLAKLLRENPYHHGPIRNGDCSACHDPHAGDHFRLLLNDYPAEFYAPFRLETYDLCFNCHVPDLVLEPAGEGITGFCDQTAEGARNLHYVHVNQEKGRTCRACHEVHASSQPFHIRESVPFGEDGWPLAINFSVEEGGGSCAPACHKPQTYRRPANSSGARSKGVP